MAKNQNNQDTLSLSPQALEFLGLSQQPFTSNILSADAIFTDASLDQLFETIKHHLQFSDLILIIEGDLGSGKTTMFRHLIQDEVPNLKLLSIHAEANDTLVQIQQKISIHLQDQGDANHLEDNLKHLQVFDQTPVIIIDDAHILSDTTLQELIRYQKQLEIEHETKLKILLLANTGMTRTLEQITDIQANQRYLLELPAYTPKQINAFINHKLILAGYAKEPILNSDSVQAIFKKTTGTPADIMAVAVNYLERLTRKKTGSNRLSAKLVLVIVTVLLVLAALGYMAFTFFQTAEQQAFQPPEIIQEKHTPIIEQTVIEDTNAAEPIASANETIETINSAENTTPTVEQPASDPVKETIAETIQTATQAEIEKPASPPVPAAPQPITLTEQKEKPAPVLEDTVAPEPIPVKPAPASIIKPEPVQPIKNTAVAEDPALAALSALGVHDVNWLKKQDAKNWTLQILGARDPATLVKFAKRHKLGQDSAWYKTWLKGKPWYVLVHRIYTDRDIARQSITRLPADLQKARPWVKSIASIHKVAGK
ncbi:MAG: AAA family ATPase [Gammaproteobacteria bacterium]|nr:AAA family ATPase [Gammaproteobacteria bacterium]